MLPAHRHFGGLAVSRPVVESLAERTWTIFYAAIVGSTAVGLSRSVRRNRYQPRCRARRKAGVLIGNIISDIGRLAHLSAADFV